MQAVDATTGEVIAESLDGAPMPVPDDPTAIIQVNTGVRIKGEAHA
jgi:hypothetical protein